MKRKNKFMMSIAILLSVGIFASCSEDDGTDPVIEANKTELTASIAAATTLLDNSEEGVQEGQYTVGSKNPLQTAVTAATAVVNKVDATQTEVDNTNVNLLAATATFQEKLIAPIAAEDLIAHWKFDEGSGTSAADASDNSFTGTLMVGSIYAGGGPVPSWTTDRYGDAGKALAFTKGGHIEVPSNAAFNPTEITISLWVKLDSLNTTDCEAFGGRCNEGIYFDNYLISQNYWDGYKLQTQEAKKLFATVHAVPSIYDRDTENSPATLTLKEWAHVAMSYKDGELNLYVNGELAKAWDNTPGAIKTIADRFDFLIGQELPNAKITEDPGYIINHSESAMDEVRLYKKALTGTQIASIYGQEKP
jgi:hypothetical protein